jgi:hypothetical protein
MRSWVDHGASPLDVATLTIHQKFLFRFFKKGQEALLLAKRSKNSRSLRERHSKIPEAAYWDSRRRGCQEKA